ncbi:MAG TPA: Gfo/Idh/MocA family oxidoreductase [Acidimicrobiia bacterium]|nr:Gfo/Idh/MocA family oxidoreductase [Acidimicrobiia bacterium]
MTEPVRAASIGVGWWGKELARAAAATGQIEIVSCYARTPEKCDEFSAALGCRTAPDLQSVLSDDDVEAVLVATSHSSHRQIVEEAASAGKHVFMEKPFTLTVDDARAAVDAAAKGRIVLQVGHQRRRLAAHRAMHRMIAEGEIGDIQMLEANHSLPNGFTMADEAWRRNAEESPLGSITSLAIHQVDNFLYLAGPIARVAAVTRPGRAFTIDEATGLLLEFSSGAVGTLLTSFFTPWNIRLALHGTEGAAFTVDDGAVLEFQVRGERERRIRALPQVDPVVDQLEEFARVVRQSGRPEVGGEEALAVVAVLEAAVEAARSGCFIEVANGR